MFIVALLFVFWLALHNRLGAWAALATSQGAGSKGNLADTIGSSAIAKALPWPINSGPSTFGGMGPAIGNYGEPPGGMVQSGTKALGIGGPQGFNPLQKNSWGWLGNLFGGGADISNGTNFGAGAVTGLADSFAPVSAAAIDPSIGAGFSSGDSFGGF